MLTAVVGVNWGDEGKGRMVDLFAQNQDIVVRYQGGNNAGHTVVNHLGKFVLNLLPSGILNPNVTNVMGNGMVIDIEHLCHELDGLEKAGINITPDRLKISDKAPVCMPYHVLLDGLEEDRMGAKKQGSTRKGISPAYSDKYMRQAILLGELFYPKALREHLEQIVEWKNLLVVEGYKSKPINVDEMYDWLMKFGGRLMPYICDVGEYLDNAAEQGKNIMFEAQLGTLRDIEFGIHPYTTSSSPIAAYAPIGAGIPNRKIDKTIGIVKAYSSSVGGGPFTVEMFGEEGEALRAAGGEYGATTGRPRRVGSFDVVASKYGIKMQGADELALTKIDVLSYLDKIPVCTAYEIDGKLTDKFPTGYRLSIAKPVYEYVDGWKSDISGCRSFEELPKNAQNYIRYLENKLGSKINYVSVGADRDAYFEM